jgi:phage recombination protein Bet
MKKAVLPAPSTGEVVEIHQPITEGKITEYLQTFGLARKLQPNEIGQFTRIACEFQLNPFKREIYCVAYGSGNNRTCSIIVGYEVYIKRAERTGKLNGWKAWVEGEGENLKAVVEINRKDWEHPFTHEAYWKEAVQRKKEGEVTSFWSKMPRFQLKKVAISQGFRLCFPDELGGLPYDGTELGIETPYPEETLPAASYKIIPEDEETVPKTGKSEGGAATVNSAGAAVTEKTPETRSEAAVVRDETAETPAAGKPVKPTISAELKAAGEVVMSAIGEILNRTDTEGRRYFSEEEKADARQIVASVKAGKTGLRELQVFRDFLADELSRREKIRNAA